MNKIIKKKDFDFCINELNKIGIENKKNVNEKSFYEKTKISSNIKNIIHKNIITKFKNINKDKIGHLFGHGSSLNIIENIVKKENDIFASTNSIYYKEDLKYKIDYYFGGDLFFCDKNNYKKYEIIGKKLNNLSYDKVKKISKNNKKYIDEIKNKTYVFLQVGDNDSYHKYHGFDDNGVIKCLENKIIPIMRFGKKRYSDNIIEKGFSNPTTYAIMDFLIYTGCKKIYMYGQDCGKKYYYEKNDKEEKLNLPVYNLWKEYLKKTNNKNKLIFVNSKIFPNNINSINIL